MSLAAATAGCITSDVRMLGAARPARPTGCQVAMFPSRPPDYPFVDVAYVSCDANWMLGQSACLDELQERACALGGDTLYGFSTSGGERNNGLAGTVAYRTTEARPAATPELCAPICSPGFACHAGACVPQCNPPCAAGEICGRQRTCESAPGAPAPKPEPPVRSPPG